MDRYRKLLISILALLVLSSVIAIVDISLNMQSKEKRLYSISTPKIRSGVGVVRIEGVISMSGRMGKSADAQTIINRLTELENDDRIKAIVVRINSPGGTAGATQEIYQKLWRLRKKNILLVASMGEIAASGGYYVASACNIIVANYGTITGSIGVISRLPNIKGLFDRFGIKMNVIKSGKYKDILAYYKDMTEDEKALYQQIIDSSYKKFLKDIALGRNQNQSDIEQYADGRVFSGEAALKYKLVDMLGTFDDAVDKAREMAKLPAEAPVYDEVKSPFQELLMTFDSLIKARNIMDNDYNDMYRFEYRYVQ